MLDDQTIGTLVRRLERDYISGVTTLGKYVTFSQYELLETIDAYVNSKHISGSTDSMGREKPFFNIVLAARNIWYRATDLDRKNIKARVDKLKNRVGAFIYTMHIQEWMKWSDFGTFLNKWGMTLATYGSAVSKFVEQDGELVPSVIPWNRLITDTVDFDSNPVIEKLYFTPAQLRKNKNYDQEQVTALIESQSSRKTLDGQQKDNLSDYITVYEVHGELPLAYLSGNDDDDEKYQQQMHVISYTGKKQRSNKFEDFTLYKGRESKSPYQKDSLTDIDGRSVSIGAVESLLEAQWMQNHTAKQIKDQLDLASKLIFQTSDGNYAGRNVLTSLESGDILVYAPDSQGTGNLTQVANNSHDITSLQAFGQQWKALGNEIAGISESLMGMNPPSGTAWRQTQALLQESHSLFEIMTENKGMAIRKMFKSYVLPFIRKSLNNTDELAADLDEQGISEFDAIYLPQEAIRQSNEIIKQQVLSGQIASQPDMQQLQAGVKQGLSSWGMTRFVKPSEVSSKTWKEILDGVVDDIEVDPTNESHDTQAILETLSTVLQTIATAPQILQDPNGRMVFNKILEESGAISPLQISATASQPQPPQPPQPVNSITPQPIRPNSLLTAGQPAPMR